MRRMENKTRYSIEMIPGTCAHEHLTYEVRERMAASYANPAGALRGWERAQRAADQRRRELLYSPVSRPSVRVIEV